MKDVLQERFDNNKLPPITKWKAEREKLTTDLFRLNGEYLQLRADTTAVEKIRRSVDDILREGTKTPQRTKARGMDR